MKARIKGTRGHFDLRIVRENVDRTFPTLDKRMQIVPYSVQRLELVPALQACPLLGQHLSLTSWGAKYCECCCYNFTRQPSQLLSWPYFFAPLIGLLDEDNWPSICIAMFVLEVLDWEKVYLVKSNLRYQSRRHEVDNQQEERHHWIIVKNGNYCQKWESLLSKMEIIVVKNENNCCPNGK